MNQGNIPANNSATMCQAPRKSRWPLGSSGVASYITQFTEMLLDLLYSLNLLGCLFTSIFAKANYLLP